MLHLGKITAIDTLGVYVNIPDSGGVIGPLKSFVSFEALAVDDQVFVAEYSLIGEGYVVAAKVKAGSEPPPSSGSGGPHASTHAAAGSDPVTISESQVTNLTTDLGNKVDKATLDANTILYAVTDNTPAALSVSASNIVGRKATGDIASLTASEAKTILAIAAGDVSGLGGAAILNIGTTAGTVAAGDDSRFTDARTPTAHASSHLAAGGDPLSGLSPSQITGTAAVLGANTFTGNQTLSDVNIVLGTTTGTKIGTATSQKLAFYNSTPVVQPTGSIKTALTNLGLVGTPTISGFEVISTYAAKTTTYAVTTSDYIIDCTSGSFTVTLPTAASDTGRTFVIKNSGTGTITVATTSSQTIDGATTVSMFTQYESLTVVSNGANWAVI